MALFGKRKTEKDSPASYVHKHVTSKVFDDAYIKELQKDGARHFNEILQENAASFKQGLNETLEQVSNDLKAYVTKQLDVRLNEYSQSLKDAQSWTLRSLNHSAQMFQEEHQQLSETLKKNISDQQTTLVNTMQDAQDLALESLAKTEKELKEKQQQLGEALHQEIVEQQGTASGAFEETKAQIAAMKDAQGMALQLLNRSVQDLHQQHKEISETLQKNIAAQQEMLTRAFEDNMAQVVEHYLLTALGEQYDIEAQLPAIVEQLNTHKDDMKKDLEL